jgi:hypothetical protein
MEEGKGRRGKEGEGTRGGEGGGQDKEREGSRARKMSGRSPPLLLTNVLEVFVWDNMHYFT